MPATCPYCQIHFPKSGTINSRHKASCTGWQSVLGDTKPRPCLCGHESTSRTQMKRHFATCLVWKGRNRGKVQMRCLAETFESRYGKGVVHPMMVPGAVEKHQSTVLKRYGANNVFCRTSSIFHTVQASLKEKRPILRGSDNPFAWPEVQERIRQTNLLRYGTSHIQKSVEVRNKSRATNLIRYGVEEALASPIVRRKSFETCLRKYGAPHPMLNREHARRCLERTRLSGPNGLEKLFSLANPEFLYVGNGGFWVWLHQLGSHKNPDFILPGPDPIEPKLRVTKVVEIFGDFWHSTAFTGKSNPDHEREVIGGFRDIGIDCLVFWESDVRKKPEEVRQKVVSWLQHSV